MLTFGEDFCGGVYLGGKIMITAAHCVADGNPDSIYLGVDDIKKNNVHIQNFKAIKVCL